jgi:hypothetical protein
LSKPTVKYITTGIQTKTLYHWSHSSQRGHYRSKQTNHLVKTGLWPRFWTIFNRAVIQCVKLNFESSSSTLHMGCKNLGMSVLAVTLNRLIDYTLTTNYFPPWELFTNETDELRLYGILLPRKAEITYCLHTDYIRRHTIYFGDLQTYLC